MMVPVMARVDQVSGWAEFSRPKRVPLRYVEYAMPWNGVVTESSKENTALIALDSNHGVL